MTSLEGRSAIVTGASSGIGWAIAQRLAALGARVVLAARSKDALAQVQSVLQARKQSSLAVCADVSVEADVVHLFAEAAQAFGPVEILVNNAGINVVGPTDELLLDDWKRVIDINLTGTFLCTREALRTMKERRRGRILNIGSVASKVPRPHSAAYTASKFAIDGLTRSTALDGREFGVAVSVLHPGNLATALWGGREQTAREEGVMDPDDVAGIAVAMLSLPEGTNLLEAVVLPLSMPFLGRG